MEGWKIIKLGQAAKVGAGNSAPQNASLFEKGTHNFFRTSDIGRIKVGKIFDAVDKLNDLGTHKLRKWAKGTILFPKSGASTFLNHRVMLGTDGYVSSHLATIKANNKILDDNFLLYYLMTVEAQRLVPDSNYPSLNLPAIENVDVPLPPLPVQKAIVAKLDAAFASIDIAIAAAERNAENAKQLFQSYLSGVFERGGEGWHKSALGNECKFIDYRGKTPIKTEAGMRLITAKNVKKGYINLNPQEFVSPNSYDEWMTRGIPQYGDVLFTTEAPLGHVAQLDTTEKVVVGQRLITLQVKSGNITSTFLKYMLLSSPWQKMLSEKSTGATVQGIKASLLKIIPVLFPSLEVQDLIIMRLLEIDNIASQLAEIAIKKKAHLNSLKQSLLQQAFTGQLVDA